MSTIALNIKMDGKLAVVIGGGGVALRKSLALLSAGAFVKIVALQINPELEKLQRLGSVTIRIGDYAKSDLEKAFLVIAATNVTQINEQICYDAKSLGILVSSAEAPEIGDCTFSAMLRRGKLEIAVSTNSTCPVFAAEVRDKIATVIGTEYAVILEQLAKEREKLLTNGSPSTYNTKVLRSLAGRLLAELTDRGESLP